MQATAARQLTAITEDDATIAAALEHADVTALLMATIHITGDETLLDDSCRPTVAQMLTGGTDGLDDEQRAAIRARAAAALRDYRDRGSPPLPAPSADLLRRMLAFIGGEAMPEYRYDMMLESAGLSALELPAPQPDSASVRSGFLTVIIGAGMSGILTGIHLDKLGIPYVIIEKNAEVGGTWYSNSYPGCRVDVPSHFYSYSFAQNPEWPYHYSERDHLLEYFQKVAADYDIRRNIQFESEATQAVWSSERKGYTITIRRADGTTEDIWADVLVSAVGTLSRPKLPNIPGRGDFAGRATHTGSYDRSIVTEGKRVAVVGTAASAVQAVPEIAEAAENLVVFQRNAHWIFSNQIYRDTLTDDAKWAQSHIPFYANWYRLLIFAKVADGVLTVARIDPEWPHQDRSCSKLNDDIRIQLTKFMHEQVRRKPELMDKIIPKYPPFADRILQNTGSYLRALTRDNVDLVTDGIDHINAQGIVDKSGRQHDLDVIIYATGFDSINYLGPMDLIGEGGRSLKHSWGNAPRAYLGITVPHFPNFFMLWGPGTSSGNMIFTVECQVRYVVEAIAALAAQLPASLDCREDVLDDYVRRFREEISHLACSSASVSSWWKGETGEVLTYLPFDYAHYWEWTRRFDFDSYHYERVEETENVVARNIG